MSVTLVTIIMMFLVLEAPYTSIANRAQEIYPFLPARWIVKDKFDSINKIANKSGMIIVI